MADISKITTLDGTTYDIKDKIARNGLYYGVCATAAGTAAKVVTIDGITELTAGLTIAVKFTYANSVSSPTLNVNSLGAVAIAQYGSTAAAGTAATTGWQAGAVVILVYDGTRWQFNKGYNTNTTYSAMSSTEGKTATATSSRVITADVLRQIAGTVSYYFGTQTNGVFTAKSAIAVSDMIVSEDGTYQKIAAGVIFDLRYPILIQNITAIAANGAIIHALDNAYLITDGIRNIMGSTWTGTANAPIWLVVASNSDGKCVVNSSIFTQTIPTSEDGLYYIKVGYIAKDTYSLVFRPSNDLYAYRSGKFRKVDPYLEEVVGDIETLLAAI